MSTSVANVFKLECGNTAEERAFTLVDKIAVLLADADALRRDGMAAVVHGTGTCDVVAQCSDGMTALDEIRALEPEIAVIDLNLPKLHGIEVIRNVRSEQLSTKVIIVSGTDDDDIIREVVRAGADGFLLKNGPARHLLDAINYVRDGGQYFSPHLRRDGLDRELLQERPQPPLRESRETRSPRESSSPRESNSRDRYQEQYETRTPASRDSKRNARPGPIRERLRERIQAENSENLDDRDYEILSMMAEGIRPILDRLDDIEGRVSGMETGLEPVPQDPAGWLSNQFADTLGGGGGRQVEVATLGRSVRELEARLPKLIEETVTQRFQSMAGKLQKEIEDQHIKTLETFVKNIQVKLVSRVSALERDMATQAENMNQLRESSQRTEENLSRLISGVDRLAQDLPIRLQRAAEAANAASGRATENREDETDSPAPAPTRTTRPESAPTRKSTRRASSSSKFKILGAVAGLLVLIVGIWALTTWLGKRNTPAAPPVAANEKTAETAAKPPAPPPANADTKTKMEAADDFVRRKDYPAAEEIYRQVVKSEPKNVDALKALASVLYKQEKLDESAAILEKIPAQ